MCFVPYVSWNNHSKIIPSPSKILWYDPQMGHPIPSGKMCGSLEFFLVYWIMLILFGHLISVINADAALLMFHLQANLAWVKYPRFRNRYCIRKWASRHAGACTTRNRFRDGTRHEKCGLHLASVSLRSSAKVIIRPSQFSCTRDTHNIQVNNGWIPFTIDWSWNYAMQSLEAYGKIIRDKFFVWSRYLVTIGKIPPFVFCT